MTVNTVLMRPLGLCPGGRAPTCFLPLSLLPTEYMQYFLQCVLVCFIYFSKVKIADFLQSFRSLNISNLI